MLDRFHSFLKNATSWRVAIFMFLLTIGLLVAYFNYVEPLAEMGGGAAHLDVRYGVGYTQADVIAYFETLGTEGRTFYARTTIFDTVWPLCIALCGVLWAPLAFRRKWLVLAAAFCPLMFGILDVIENMFIWTMLAQFPDVSSGTAAISNAITLTKQAMIPGWVIAILGLPMIAIIRLDAKKWKR